MKPKLIALVLTFTGAVALSTPPPQDPNAPMPNFPVFVPSGGGVKGKARMFPLTLVTDACDRGFEVQLIRAPGLVHRYRLWIREIHRGQCGQALSPDQLDRDVDGFRAADGSTKFVARHGDKIVLSDRRPVKDDEQPTWVLQFEDEMYQALKVDPGNNP